VRQKEKTGLTVTWEEYEEYFFSINAIPLFYIHRDPDYLSWKKMPIYVNKKMMNAKEIIPKSFFKNRSIYEQAFFDESQTTKLSKEDFLCLNQRFYPERNHLKIYDWDTSFTNYYNCARDCFGAYLWSICDEERNRLTVISISLIPQA